MVYRCQNWEPRITVACVAQRDDGKFLCVEEYSQNRPVIGQPSGHVERGETIIDACIRETLEETGYTVNPTGVVSIQQWHKPNTDLTFFRFVLSATLVDFDENAELDEGIIQPLWFNRDELALQQNRLRTDIVLTTVDQFLNEEHAPLSLLKSYL